MKRESTNDHSHTTKRQHDVKYIKSKKKTLGEICEQFYANTFQNSNKIDTFVVNVNEEI